MKRAFIYFCFLFSLSASAQNFIAKDKSQLPIKPARTISFTIDEGSYMDVNASPDGKTLVFTLLGDLYAVSSSGGNAKQLTRGLALNLQPVWSPDSKSIAYISDYSGALHLNIRDIAGKSHVVLGKSHAQIGPGWTKPIWSSNGNDIYIGRVSSEYPNIGYSLTGGIVNHLQKHSYFSINNRGAYYMSSAWLCRDDLKDYKSEKVDSIGDVNNQIISPDGRWLAYTIDSEDNKRSLIVRDVINHKTQELVSSLIQVPYLPEYRQPSYSFSSDSKNIYIGYGGKIHRIDVQTGEDHIIPFSANVKSDLGSLVYNTYRVTHDSVQIKFTRSANTSPDGKHLAFMAMNKLYVMDLPNGKPRQLVSQPDISQFQPVYSSDGKWIAYVSWCDTIGGHLWRVPALGGTPEQLTHTAGQYQRPCWSPDGKSIAVIKGDVKFSNTKYGEHEYGQLQIINVNDHRVKLIDADMIPLWNQISFSNDGTRVIYQPKDFDYINYRDGNDSLKPRLVSRDLNGQKEIVLAIGSSSTKEPEYFQQRSISPDGRFIVYTMREDIYLVPVSTSMNTPIIFDSKQHNSMIRFAAGIDPHWEEGGKMLAWTYSNRFYRIDPDKIIEAARKKIASDYADTGLMKLTIIPDEEIFMDLKVPAFYGNGTVAFKNVRILTMQKNKVIEKGTIIIKDGRFAQVGITKQVKIPNDATVFDLNGTTVMPGIIDMHMHVNCRENVYPLQRGDYLANLAYGVTTGRDPASSYDAFGAAELLASGESIGPRLFTVGRTIFQYSNFKLDDFSDALAIAKKRQLLGGNYIKQYCLSNRLQKQWLLLACKQTGLNMTNEGNDGTAGNNALEELSMIKDGSTGVEHNPDWGDVYRDIITFFAKSGSYLGETLGAGYGPEGDRYFNYTYWNLPNDKKLKRFATVRYGDDSKVFENLSIPPDDMQSVDSLVRYQSMIDAQITTHGGKVTLGAHGSSPIGVTAHNILWAMKMGGITNMQTLQQATIRGAEALGMQKDLGSIEIGKIADLIILDKNPLEDIHNTTSIKYVMKAGVLYEADTLNEIWPEKKPCPEWRMKPEVKN